METLAGKVALVTGGTGALGRAVSAAFARAGASLFVTYVVDDEVAPFRAAVPDGSYELVKADLEEPPAVRTLVERITSVHRRVDVLVHLVGGFWGGPPLAETGDADLERMWTLNFKTAFHCARAVVPGMMAQRRGRVLFVASRAALEGGATIGAYAIAKGAVATMTRVLADEVRDHGITVNAVAPSTIDTPGNRQAMPDADPSRWVPPEQIAATLLFLASDAAQATSGVVLPVYGRG